MINMTTTSEKQQEHVAVQDILAELQVKEHDISLAASLGQALLTDNTRLRSERSHLLEEFQQKIYGLEAEKHTLKLRLESVETDYDHQIKELQSDIVTLRLDVHKQRSLAKELEVERNTVVSELSQANQQLSQELQNSSSNQERLEHELESVKVECSKRKSLLQNHFQQVDMLRREIGQLRGEKFRLEDELTGLTHERDELAENLAAACHKMNLLQDKQRTHMETINAQDSQIAHLEAKADCLREQIANHPAPLIPADSSSSRGHDKSMAARPQSLLAELAEQRIELLHNRGIDLFHSPFSAMEDDDDVEMDDEALMAVLRASVNHGGSVDSLLAVVGDTETNQSEPVIDARTILVDDLRSEVGEIYQQMRQMCVDLKTLDGGQRQADDPDHKQQKQQRGTNTPDELAMVEMDFRLSSLRSVLGDLRGLLKELVADSEPLPVSDAPDTKPQIPPTDSATSKTGDASCDQMLRERDTLAAEIATAKQRVSQLRQEIEASTGASPSSNPIAEDNANLLAFVANWQELEDDDYEFEMPR